MNSSLALLLLLLAQTPDVPDWENPEVFERHRESPHASYIPHDPWMLPWPTTRFARPTMFLSTDGVGLLAVGIPMLDVSAYPFLNEDFDAGDAKRQRHTTDVKRRELVTLNLDYKQMGVGGDTSWGGRTHPEYTLPAKGYRYRPRLRPFSTTDPPPMTLSKEKF